MKEDLEYAPSSDIKADILALPSEANDLIDEETKNTTCTAKINVLPCADNCQAWPIGAGK